MTDSDDNQIAAVGNRHVWGGVEPFGLRHADRRQHVYTLGKSGSGKSTLLKNLLIQDIQAGHGASVVDPHGDLADELLSYIPPWRADHLVYFSPADLEYPVAYNILAGAKPDDTHLIASAIVSGFKAIWSSSWGARMEYLLFNAVYALVECCQKTSNVTLLGIPRMLTDQAFREWVLTHVSDVAVRSFWLTEFAGWDQRFRAEAISPVQNKIGALLVSPVIRNTLGQVRKSFDLRYVLDNGRIFIANLSKGRIGEDKANLLGALLITQFEQAALSRADLPPSERRDHFLVIDEFQNYLVDSIPRMMAETRKYGLGLTLSHQHTAQILPEVRDAIFGNSGSIISFRTSEKDALILSREFGGVYAPEQFTDLANFEVLVKLLHHGRHPEPFRAATLPPTGYRYGRSENLIARSRQRYATPRKIVEDKIQRWMKG